MEAPNQEQIYNSALSTVQAQNAPVIQSLQAQQPTLEHQYNSLVSDLKGQQGIALGNTGEQTRRDFGASGIDIGSGLFSQTLGARQQPITQDYTNRLNTASTNQTSALQQLATQIAQAQSGVTDQARQLAQQQYANQFSAYQSQLDENYRQQQLRAAKASLPNPGYGNGGGNPNAPGAQAVPQAAVLSALGKFSKDQYVDDNEQMLAFNQLRSAGYSVEAAHAAIASILNNKVNKYQSYTAPAKLPAYNPNAVNPGLLTGGHTADNSNINLGNMKIGGSIR